MFKDIVKASRSYRGYDESYRFSREELEDFVDCARFAPSSVNAQPFRYYLAWENEEVDRIQKLTNWARALPQMQLPHPGMCPTGFIIICQDLNLGASIPRYQKDVGIVAQTMLLAAAERGLGGCMIGNYNADSVQKRTAPRRKSRSGADRGIWQAGRKNCDQRNRGRREHCLLPR